MKPIWLKLSCVLCLSVGFHWYTHSFSTSSIFAYLNQSLSACLSYGTYCCLWIGDTCAYPFKQYYKRTYLEKELCDKLACIRQERDELLAQVIRLSACEQRYKDIQELLEFKKRYKSHKSLVAGILSKQFLPHAHFCIIDLGSKQGIKPDMIVVYKNSLLGRVTQVHPTHSIVQLISDKQCKIAVHIPGTDYKAIHEGLGLTDRSQVTQLYDTMLKLESTLQLGQLVMSSGEGTIFPRGFGVGRITAITREEFNYTLTLEHLVAVETLDYCSVLID